MTIRAVEEAVEHVKTQLGKLPEGKRYPLNEWPTHYILVDPILEALGWRTHDYDDCEVEALMPDGQYQRKADYLLYNSKGRPVVVIEAKCLWDDLDNDSSVEQLAGYARELRQGVGVLTNGTEWHLYKLNRNIDFTGKRVVRVDVLDGVLREKAQVLHEWLDAGNWWESRRCHRCRYHRGVFGLLEN